MSANRKKTLFIALACLLASSTAVAVLVRTFQGDVSADPYAGTAGSTPHTGAEHADDITNPFYPLNRESVDYLKGGCASSVEGGCEFGPLALGGEAPAALDFKADAPLEAYAALADLAGAAQGAGSRFGDGSSTSEDPLSLDYRQLTSDITRPFGGGYNFEPVNPAPGLGSPDPVSPGTDPQEGPCGVTTSCVPVDEAPGSVPGDGDSPIEGSPITPVPVPEPGTMGLLAFGLALVAFMGRRRRAPI